jgi:hypothetical protein
VGSLAQLDRTQENAANQIAMSRDAAAGEQESLSNHDFTMTISVDQTPKQSFDAIRNVRGWWSEEIEGSTDQIGDEFNYHFKDMHSCTMKLIELVPDKKAAWLVTDNHFNFIEDQAEWKGTKVIFELSPRAGETEIRFTHEGLVPEYECFKVCSNAWGMYINGSLRSLIATGKGNPNPKE